MALRETRDRFGGFQSIGLDTAEQQIDALVGERHLDPPGTPLRQELVEQIAERIVRFLGEP